MTVTAAAASPSAPPLELASLSAGGPAAAHAGAIARAAADAFVSAAGERIVEAAGDFVLEQSGLAARPAPKPKTTTPKELAFLDDPRMSVHEKVYRLLKYFQLKYDRELEAQMKKFRAQNAAKEVEKAKKKGILGASLPSWMKKAIGITFPAVGMTSALLGSDAGKQFLKELSGPLLAAGCVALGMPQLAPLAAQLGPSVVDGLADAQEAVLGEGEGGGSKASAASSESASGSEAKSSDAVDEKDIALELQYLMEKQRAMTGLLSNAMKAMHDTTMAVVGNLR